MTSRKPLYVLFGVVVVDLIGFGVVVPILPYYAESYGASATVLGLLLTCYAAMQFVFAPLWGRLSDRIGRRPVMLLTIAGTSAALLVLGLAPSLAWLFVARLLGGIFSANISVAGAFVGDVTAEEERTRWMGMIGAAFGIGFILGPALGGLLAPYGYHVPMLTAAGLAAANLVLAIVLLPEPARHEEKERPLVAGKGAWSNPAVRSVCTAAFLFAFAVSQLETVFAFYMLHRFGWDAREVAFILVWMAVVMVGVQGGAIRGLVTRHGERRLVFAGSLLLVASFASIPWLPTVALLLVPLSVASFARGITHPSMMGLVSKQAEPGQRGVVMGAFQSSASLARMIGPIAAGALYDRYRAYPFLLAAVLLVGVSALAASWPKRRALAPPAPSPEPS